MPQLVNQKTSLDPDGDRGVKIKDWPERWYAGHRIRRFVSTARRLA